MNRKQVLICLLLDEMHSILLYLGTASIYMLLSPFMFNDTHELNFSPIAGLNNLPAFFSEKGNLFPSYIIVKVSSSRGEGTSRKTAQQPPPPS